MHKNLQAERDLDEGHQTQLLYSVSLRHISDECHSCNKLIATFAEIRSKVEDAYDWFRDCSAAVAQGKASNFLKRVYPTSPRPTPLKKPNAPSSSAPSIGFIFETSEIQSQLHAIKQN
jgi:hypothetical protein